MRVKEHAAEDVEQWKLWLINDFINFDVVNNDTKNEVANIYINFI